MLKIYDKNHEVLGNITEYDEYKIEHDVSTGDKTLYFDYYGTLKIDTEYYVQNDTDEYVIKEKSVTSGDKIEYVAALNLEELEAVPWESFQVTDSTIDDAARLALTGTGWTVGTGTVTKKRNAGMVQQSTLGVIQKLCTAFMCECTYDTKNKVVTFYEQVGEDKGVYFTKQLNLLKLTKKDSSYDYYTRIIPIGADDLTIESVNDGVKYLENYQYSNKVRSYIWEDSNYTDPQALKDDAEKKLADMSKPTTSYSVDVVDLAAQTNDYDLLAFHVGDTVQLFDEETGVKDSQRIMKLTEYPDNPEKNSCELANTVLTWEELHQKEQEAADIVGTVISSDGKIKVSDILHFDSGVSSSQSFIDLSGDVNNVKAKIGTIETNYLTAEQAKVLYATIESLEATDASITNLNAEYASFKSTVTDEFAADEAQFKVLDADKADIDFANVAVAKIETGFLKNLMVSQGLLADKVISPEVTVTDCLTGVHIYADDITAGTLSVDQLEIRGSEKSLVYELNNIDGALQSKSVDTLNGEVITDRSITTNKVVANAITANEIAAGAVVAEKIAANTITGDKIAANTIKAEQIDVEDVFAQDIKATGTIDGATLKGAKGFVGGWTIGETALSMDNYASGREYTKAYIQVTANSYTPEVTITGAAGYVGDVDVTVTNISDDGRTVTVAADETGNGSVSIAGTIPCAGKYKVQILSSYHDSYAPDDWISGQVKIKDSSGTILKTISVDTGTLSGIISFEITDDVALTSGATISLNISYSMFSMVKDTPYTIEVIVNKLEGEVPLNPETGIPENYLIAIKQKRAGEESYRFVVTEDGDVTAANLEVASDSPMITFTDTTNNKETNLIYDSSNDKIAIGDKLSAKNLAYKSDVDDVATNVSTLTTQLGTTDISAIGDGTVTGAVSALNGVKTTYKTWCTNGEDVIANAPNGVSFFSVNPNRKPSVGLPSSFSDYGTCIIFKGAGYTVLMYSSVLGEMAAFNSNSNKWPV